MFPKLQIEHFSEFPRVLEVSLNNKNTLVCVHPQALFNEMFPNGETNGDPAVWGIVLSDVIRHVAKAHHQALCSFYDQGLGPEPPSEEKVLDRLMDTLIQETQKEVTLDSGLVKLMD